MRISTISAAILLAALAPAVSADYTTMVLSAPGAAQGYAVFNGNQAGAATVDGVLQAYFWNGGLAGANYTGAAFSATIHALSSTLAVGYTADASGNSSAVFWNLGNPNPQPLLVANDSDSYSSTNAVAISGSTIVGSGNSQNEGQTHALVWNTTSAAPTDLHNLGGFAGLYVQSLASGVDANHVVGYASFTATLAPHAILWNTATASYADLHDSATGLQNSQALGISGKQIVGYGLTDDGDNSNLQGLLWTLSGPDDSIITYTPLVNPAGDAMSQAAATNGSLIVGIASDAAGDNPQAIVWTSTATYESLPTPVGDISEAFGIDADGNIVGAIADPVAGQVQAVLWSPVSTVPEPASLALLLPAAALFLRRRTRR